MPDFFLNLFNVFMYCFKKIRTMKTIALIICLLSIQVFAGEEKTVTSKISKVTVYQQGAQIERKASYSVGKGITTVIIEGISPNIDPRSLQINASGNVIILDSKYTVFYPQPEPVQHHDNSIPPKIQKEIILLEDSLFTLEYDILSLQSQIDVLNSEKSIIENNGTIKGQGKVNDSIPLLKDALEFYHEKMIAINAELLDLSREKIILVKKQNRMKLRLSDLKNYNANNNLTPTPNKPPIHQIHITLSAEEPVSGRISASYLVNNAGWVPLYDLRSSAAEGKIDLTYKAQVYQNTGVNWEGVKLHLSTNNPYANKTKPTLTPWYLDYYTYRNDGYSQNNKKEMNGVGSVPTLAYSAKDSEMSEDDYNAQTTKNFTTIIEQLISVEYAIDLPYDIQSDGQMNMVLVNQETLNTEFLYYAVPKLDLSIFLVARITDLGKLNLVPGKTNLFHDGAYIGETYLNPMTMDDTLDVSLGKDPNIVATRTLLKNESKEKIVGEKIVKTYAYLIEIKNHKKETIKLTVQDQIPVTRNNEIEVELIESDRGDLNEISGIINWNKRIKAYDTETINLVYTVKYEKTKTVNLASN